MALTYIVIPKAHTSVCFVRLCSASPGLSSSGAIQGMDPFKELDVVLYMSCVLASMRDSPKSQIRGIPISEMRILSLKIDQDTRIQSLYHLEHTDLMSECT